MEFSIQEWIIICAIVSLGCVIQGNLGFGFGLVVAPILYLIHPQFVPTPTIFVNLVFALIISYRNRSALHRASFSLAMAGRALGTVLGAWVLLHLSPNGITIVLGLSVLLAVGLSAFGGNIPFNRKNLTIAGLLSGFTATTTSVGGPPLALVYQKQPAEVIRGNMSGLFVGGSIFSLISLFFVGKFGWPELHLSFYLMPGLCLGLMLAHFTQHWLATRFLRPLILILCGIAGIMMIFRGVF